MTKPGDGERRAASGYRSQYLVGASIILKGLEQGDLEWIRIADPEAGRVDDLQIAKTARVDAYQVKWAQYGGTITLRDLTYSTSEEPALIHQLAQGWKQLSKIYPHRRVVVHLATNQIPSASPSAKMPKTKPKPQPYHLSSFIEQSWRPVIENRIYSPDIAWKAVWKQLQDASGLSDKNFPAFVMDCRLDFGTPRPVESSDIKAIADLLFATAANPERIIEMKGNELLGRLGWTQRYSYRNLHEFPAPKFLYRPIQNTVNALEEILTNLSGGYIGIFGPPGSGKSTLLTKTLRMLPVRLVRYYAYVPEAQDPSVLRGESINFFHDVTLRLDEAGICCQNRPDPTDRIALIHLFHEQLQELGQDYRETGTKSVILIDGLDHIAREQHPDRSLLHDLPLPNAVPTGVYIIIGSQTEQLPNLPPSIHRLFKQDNRTIKMGHLNPSDVRVIAQEAFPDLTQDEHSKIYQLSGGHPLALIYLLNRLTQVETPQERDSLITTALPYEGDIEEQYYAHWRNIEEDFELVQLLGLLARVRGPISMKWVARWADSSSLRKLKRLFTSFFSKDHLDRWEFFHNSFRIFLEAQTADPLPGQTVEQINQEYHRKLADFYEQSPVPWQWETLYHRYRAGDFAVVLDTATYKWFRDQVESLRPIEAVETDVRLALKVAGELLDVVGLIRLTLVGAALQQRADTLKDTSLPHLLIDVGKKAIAADYVRDGVRLRVNEEKALSLSVRLATAGLEEAGQRIFELAEPLEYLSGRPIPANNVRGQDRGDLLKAWVSSASLFRGAAEVVSIVRRIQAEPTFRNKDKGIQKSSLEFQNWLLYQGALSCGERHDWVGWQTFYDALDKTRDYDARYLTLLHSAKRSYDMGQTDKAGQLLEQLLSMEEPRHLGEGRWLADVLLWQS